MGFLTSYFAPTIEVLYLTLGAAVGFGSGLIQIVDYTIIPYYFDKKLGMATGITQTGTSVGIFLFSAINEVLVTTYGLKGSMLILGAVALHIIPLGMLLESKTRFIENYEYEDQSPAGNNGGRNTEMQSLITDENKKYTDDKTSPSDTIENKASGQHVCQQTINKKTDGKGNSSGLIEMLGLDLFNDRFFTLSILGSTSIILSHWMVPTVLPDHILWIGGSRQQAANALIIIGVANALSRLMNWKLSKEHTTACLNILAVSSIISGLSLVSCVFYTQYWMFVSFSVLFGITRGIYIIYFALFLVTLIGKERGHHGFGINHTIRGLALLIGMPIFGILADATHKHWGYGLAFIAVGFLEIIAGVIFGIIKFTWKE